MCIIRTCIHISTKIQQIWVSRQNDPKCVIRDFHFPFLVKVGFHFQERQPSTMSASFFVEDCSGAGKYSKTLQSKQCLGLSGWNRQTYLLYSNFRSFHHLNTWSDNCRGDIWDIQSKVQGHLPMCIISIGSSRNPTRYPTGSGQYRAPNAEQELQMVWFGRCRVYSHTSG